MVAIGGYKSYLQKLKYIRSFGSTIDSSFPPLSQSARVNAGGVSDCMMIECITERVILCGVLATPTIQLLRSLVVASGCEREESITVRDILYFISQVTATACTSFDQLLTSL